MSNHVSIEGRLGQDPELRWTSAGKPVLNGSVADTPRRFNRDTNAWEDAGETLWLRFSLWGPKAEAAAEVLRKGDLVTATGRLKQRSFEQDGQRRTVVEMDADSVGKVATASANGGQQQPGGFGGQPQVDPWATGGNTGGQQSGGWDSPAGGSNPIPF